MNFKFRHEFRIALHEFRIILEIHVISTVFAEHET